MDIKKGQIITMTEGMYDDYEIMAHVRALKDFNSTAEMERFRAEGDYLSVPPWGGEPCAYDSTERFLGWLHREKLVGEAGDEVVELYLGEYSKLNHGDWGEKPKPLPLTTGSTVTFRRPTPFTNT